MWAMPLEVGGMVLKKKILLAVDISFLELFFFF